MSSPDSSRLVSRCASANVFAPSGRAIGVCLRQMELGKCGSKSSQIGFQYCAVDSITIRSTQCPAASPVKCSRSLAVVPKRHFKRQLFCRSIGHHRHQHFHGRRFPLLCRPAASFLARKRQDARQNEITHPYVLCPSFAGRVCHIDRFTTRSRIKLPCYSHRSRAVSTSPVPRFVHTTALTAIFVFIGGRRPMRTRIVCGP